jgi:SAM-dependent methyltransferase
MPLTRASDQALLLEGPGGPIPLGYVEEGDRVHLIAREGSARWPVDMLRSGEATVRLPSGVLAGTPRLVIDEGEKRRILELFLAKYGPAQYQKWYDHPRRVITIQPGSIPATDHYFDWLQAEFDNIAEEYDHHITGNRMNRLLRDRSLALLRPTFRSAPRLLEIGCGSGMETLSMLQEGHEIVAVDISEKMLDVVRRKATAARVGERFTGVRAKASDLPGLVVRLEPPFDGAYSTYGALNCEPQLRPVATALAQLLPTDRNFVAGIYNRWCLFELAGYGMTFQWERALGRRRNPVPVGASRFCVDTYAYSLPEFIGQFRPEFEPTRSYGVPVLLPPSDLTSYSERFARHFDILSHIDRRFGSVWPLSGLGDHFLTVLRRAG